MDVRETIYLPQRLYTHDGVLPCGINRSLVAMQFANSYFFRKKFLPLIKLDGVNFVLVDERGTGNTIE